MRLLAQHPEQSGGYVNVNAGKRSITIDLTNPEAIPLIKRLVAISDIVVENFSPRVMPKLGLDYETLRQIKPDLIMLSLPGFGAEGPYRDYVSYGPNIMSVSGLTHLTGYPDGPPSGVTFGYGDYVGGINGVVAILAAVYYRDQTGLGQYVNLAQFEAAVAFLGPAVLETTATGREPNRQGNRHPDAAPHGVYPCAGEDRWCAIAVTSDDQWRIFAGVLGRPELAADARFATLAARKAHEAEIDALIADWTRPQAAEDVMTACQSAGVAAAVAVTIADLLERDPQIAARGYYEAVDHPHLAGLKIDGATFQLSETPGGYRGAGGGLLGEGNDYVFQDLLGMDEGEIARLMEAGVINRHLATHLQAE
jgi:benzylsuccinate CoA-transferase BbsF subunit